MLLFLFTCSICVMLFNTHVRPCLKEFLEQPYGRNSYSKCVHILTWERGVEKSVLRCVRTKWMAPNKCCGIFCVQWYSQVHYSITASKENAVVFFHHKYDNFILCDN